MAAQHENYRFFNPKHHTPSEISALAALRDRFQTFIKITADLTAESGESMSNLDLHADNAGIDWGSLARNARANTITTEEPKETSFMPNPEVIDLFDRLDDEILTRAINPMNPEIDLDVPLVENLCIYVKRLKTPAFTSIQITKYIAKGPQETEHQEEFYIDTIGTLRTYTVVNPSIQSPNGRALVGEHSPSKPEFDLDARIALHRFQATAGLFFISPK